MSQVSKYPISKKVYETIFNALFSTFVNLRTKNQVYDFFEDFFSPTEKVMLAKRLAIGLLLSKEYTYAEIKKILRVSSTTIGVAALRLKHGGTYKKVIDKLVNDDKFKEFWSEVGEKIASVAAAGRSKSDSWIYLRKELRKKRLEKPF